MVRTQQIVNQTENQKYDLPDVSIRKQRTVSDNSTVTSNNSASEKDSFEMENIVTFWLMWSLKIKW